MKTRAAASTEHWRKVEEAGPVGKGLLSPAAKKTYDPMSPVSRL